MNPNERPIRLLLVDDESEFRSAVSKALARRGILVIEAASGEEGLRLIAANRPDIAILDLKMPGLSGAETLARIRREDASLPVIILTGHGHYEDAIAGLHFGVVDFLHKPVDMESLAARVVSLLQGQPGDNLREHTIGELMVAPERYPSLLVDQPIAVALRTLWACFSPEDGGDGARQVRSARVLDRSGRFLGLLRFSDLLQLALPDFLLDSPHGTCFTGMFLAQCKVLGKRRIVELLSDELVAIEEVAPLMQAVKLMVEHRLINLPVMRGDELVGVLRESDIVYEMLRNLGSLPPMAGGGGSS